MLYCHTELCLPENLSASTTGTEYWVAALESMLVLRVLEKQIQTVQVPHVQSLQHLHSMIVCHLSCWTTNLWHCFLHCLEPRPKIRSNKMGSNPVKSLLNLVRYPGTRYSYQKSFWKLSIFCTPQHHNVTVRSIRRTRYLYCYRERPESHSPRKSTWKGRMPGTTTGSR